MWKITIFLAVVSLAYFNSATPTPGDDKDGLSKDDWFDDFKPLVPLDLKFDDIPTPKTLTDDDIKNLKGQPNGYSEGKSEHHSSSTKTVNGKVVEDKKADSEIDNNNGTLTETKSSS